jgi:hypothetical protein
VRRKGSISGTYRGWYFRSLKELSYAVKLDKEGRKWRSAENKEFLVEYLDLKGKKRRHWPDFFVDDCIIVEVKPTSKMQQKLVLKKSEAMRAFCLEKGYTYEIISPRRIQKTTLKKMYDTGLILIDGFCLKKFNAFLNKKSKMEVKNESIF